MMRTRWRMCCSAAATPMSSIPHRWASAGWSRRTSITGRVPTATSIRRGTYHKADRNAIGIDRTADGTGYVLQYPEALRRRFESTQTCPDELLLFFHRLPYTFKMRDGRTLIQRIYDDHFEGYEWVERAASILKALPLPDFDRALVDERIGRQLHNAREWRDIINTFFHRLSGIEDVHERKIYR